MNTRFDGRNPRRGNPNFIEILPLTGWPKLDLLAVWRQTEIILILAKRDIKVRYKQRMIGFGWAIVEPLLTMIVFTAIFAGIVKVPTDGAPYPLFSLCALVPWGYFVHCLNTSTTCLVSNGDLIKRVYFPRLVFPVSAVISGMVDFLIAFTLLLVLIVIYEGLPSAAILLLPAFLLFAVLTALAIGLWLSALNVQYRDVSNVLPFLTQIFMFISPVAYPASVIPEKWLWLYSLNPMATVISGFRWALLENQPAPGIYGFASLGVVLIVLVGGLYFFRRQEDRFADVI